MTGSEIARAYDAVAAGYDNQVAVDNWVRQLLWQHFASVFRSGQKVLDVACGTGLDALYLARRGLHVTGIDVSPGMLAKLQAKAIEAGVEQRIHTYRLDANDWPSWPAGPFDGIISSFAGLNTMADLEPFARAARRCLVPDGQLIIHVLNRFSLWEWMGLLWQGRWSDARHLHQQRERTFAIGGKPVRHYLFSPYETYRQAFAPTFHLRRLYGIGILRPPSGFHRVPQPLVKLLTALEQAVRSYRPFAAWGRFFVLDMAPR